jgi:CRISPR/Cas system CSM-associated protein Csm3 (group 7 of RAMP superfamily)
MARNIYSRLHLSGTLVAESPLHVGGNVYDVDTDMPLARDGAGQLYIPGTSLAGALREHAEQLFGIPFVSGFWGDVDSDHGRASYVFVNDVPIIDADDIAVEIRDGVGLDRQWGSAAEHIKYDRAMLPHGSRLIIDISVEVLNRDYRAKTLAMVASLKYSLEQGQVRLGAAKTRGLGSIRLIDAEISERIYGTKEGILNLLRKNSGVPVSESELDQARKLHPVLPRPKLTFKIHWKPVGPLMVKAGFNGIAVDMIPLMSCVDGDTALVLPGSSIKGALRSQAERIIRTVLQHARLDWVDESNPRTRFLKEVELVLIDELFGKRGERILADDARPWKVGLGAMSISDCYCRRRIPQKQWQEIQSANDDVALRDALREAGLEHWTQDYHVAIDRWLGSAAESMLYTVLEPHLTEWEPLTLELNLQRLPEDLHMPGLALILMVIRDLSQKRIPLGFAANRGMGNVVVEKVDVSGADLPEPLSEIGDLSMSDGLATGLSPNLRQAINAAWRTWIEWNQGVIT